MLDLTYKKAVEKAIALKDLGQTKLFLSGRCGGTDYPWHLVTECHAGGTHRLGIPVSVNFCAEDSEVGLTFVWFFDIEKRDANGSGSFDIDTEACRWAMSQLPEAARSSFRQFLLATAKAVRERAAELQTVADQQRVAAQILSDLCAGATA